MKKTFLATIAFLVITSAASAQTISHVDLSRKVPGIMTSSGAGETTPANEAPAVNAKVLRSFNKTFAGVTPTWRTSGEQFLAYFSADGNNTHALYSQKGRMVYSVTHGSARLLPANVTRLLQNAYPGHTISAASVATSDGLTVWFADLKTCNSLVVAKVFNGEIVEATRYNAQ